MITRFPTTYFLLGINHFWRSCKFDKYSFFHLCQKVFVVSVTVFHRFKMISSRASFILISWVSLGRSKSLGLSAGLSRSSSPIRTNELSLLILSAQTKYVNSTSSSTDFVPIGEYRILLTDLIIRLHTSPLWLADGGLNFHFMFRSFIWPSSLSLLCCSNCFLSSASAPMNFPPLSLYIIPGDHLLSMNLVNTNRKYFMDGDWDSSRCTALHWMQVNMQPYRFSSNLTLRTNKGPKQSTPTALNGLQWLVTPILGNGAICYYGNGAFSFLKVKQMRMVRLIPASVLTIQKRSRKISSMWLTPTWPSFFCTSHMIALVDR